MNRPQHLSDDELIGLLYGLGDGDGHLTHCSECGERWRLCTRVLPQLAEKPLPGGRSIVDGHHAGSC